MLAKDSNDFALGIEFVKNNQLDRREISNHARAEYSIRVSVNKFEVIYGRLLGRSSF